MKHRPNPDLVAIVQPIVRGQLRNFRTNHPDALDGKWISSIVKRIVGDLLSRDTMLRLQAAMVLDLGMPAPRGTRDALKDVPLPESGEPNNCRARESRTAADPDVLDQAIRRVSQIEGEAKRLRRTLVGEKGRARPK